MIPKALRWSSAVEDTVEAIAAWRVWVRFGWHDAIARYRRSWLGPFWLVVTMAVFVVALALVYSLLFKMAIREYLPFLAVGMVAWTFLSAAAGEAAQTFVESAGYIREVKRSLMIYVLRVLWRNALVFLNQAIVAVLVVIAFGQRPHALLGLLGIGLLLLQGLWIVLLLGVLGARFRDLGPLVQLTFQILFFVTPIIWTPAMLVRENSWIATVNPLFHVIEVVRAPLLGGVPSPVSYAGALVTLCLGLVVALGVYARFRDRIVYWL